MASKILEAIWVCFILVLSMNTSLSSFNETRKLYIVYMGSLPSGSYSPTSHHFDILQSVVSDESLKHKVLHRSYGRSFNGFAAWLTEEERAKLSDMDGISSVFLNPTLKLCTTRSWDFMGLTKNVKRYPKVESDIIIGMFDSGVWPESESFSDEGIGPVPKRWKGTCKGGANFTCNRKIIGAKIYTGESARDYEGHGTHTASIAAGNRVKRVSYFGLAKGTARGGVPAARIAVYQVCSKYKGCDGVSILSAFDDAIAEGVDIISASLGFGAPTRLDQDVFSLGSFHAMANNIITVQSAGNDGEAGLYTIHHPAPWIMTVGASTSDRKIDDVIILADGTHVPGKSLNRFSLGSKAKYPLIYANKSSSYPDLNDPFWKGKILVCDYCNGSIANVSAAAVITPPDVNHTYFPQVPGLELKYSPFDKVAKYADTKHPRATVRCKNVKDTRAPMVIGSSSRGPNTWFSDIMKPDVIAPGFDIFAAVPPHYRRLSAKYYFMSGTSMACPHVTGAAAYVKSKHPNWSPASIKSALMTTAWRLNASAHYDREFAYGSGHIDPVRACNPGLIYDISKEDYANLLVSAYGTKTCQLISGKSCVIPEVKISAKDFNYPSFTAFIDTTLTINVNFTRTVTNVGTHKSTYKANITADSGLEIFVVPSSLSFTRVNEKKSFVVYVNGTYPKDKKTLSSSLVWSDGTHSVRSPIVIYRA